MDIRTYLNSLLVITVFSSICWVSQVQSKRVLFFPYFQTSHVLQYMKAADALADLGHDVTVCMPDPVFTARFAKAPAGVKILTYGEELSHVDVLFQNYTKTHYNFWHENMNRFDFVAFMKGAQLTRDINRQALLNNTLMGTIEHMQFDLFVLDSLPFCRSLLTIPYKFDIPFVLMGPHFDHISSRIPISLPSTPMILFQEAFGNNMPFLKRLKLTIFHFLGYIHDPFWDPQILSLVAPEKPDISPWDLAVKAEMFLFETDHILDFARPVLPNTKMIGGLSPIPAKPLVGKLKQFVENSKKGVVYVAFGTQGENIPPHIVAKMIEAFRRVSLNVIWRANVSSPDSGTILATSWVPQNDILGHNKTKLFVSHCGSWSQYESLYHGVPIFCLPLCVDQFYNANRATARYFGKQADVREISAESLANLMSEVATNETYRASIGRGSELFRMHYKLPVKEAAYWLDHVMKYGGSYMRSPGQHMPLYQFLAVDVFILLNIIVNVIGLGIWFGSKRLYAYIRQSKKPKAD